MYVRQYMSKGAALHGFNYSRNVCPESNKKEKSIFHGKEMTKDM